MTRSDLIKVTFWEKIRTRISFTKIQANYTSKESLLIVVYDEYII